MPQIIYLGVKQWKHLNNKTLLKYFFKIIHFLNNAIVIIERSTIFTLNKMFCRTYICFLNLFLSFHTLHPILHIIPYMIKHIFFDHFAHLELRYLNSRNIIDLKQVIRSQTF
jgi:hypothetical protein